MGVIQILSGAVLVVLAIVITVLVLLQNSKKTGLTSVVGGGSDTFAAKNKLGMKDKKLSKITTILAIVFAVVALVSYLLV
jgi:preprotein translocase subunit SecG